MLTPVNPVISELRTAIGLLDNDTVAALLNLPANQPGAWVRGDSLPTATDAARIADVRDLASILTRVYTQQMAINWLRTPNSDLNNTTPLDMFADGARDQVISVAAELMPDVTGWPI